MLFNSISFLIFLPMVLIVYWLMKKKSLKYQNILLLLASYFFYAQWDFRFLFLLIFSTLLDYFTGLQIGKSTLKSKKKWLYISIIINLGFLAVFKYYDFFVNSFIKLFSNFGFSVGIETLNLILPVGISFYTFHGVSYVVDIYNEKIKPERNFIDYSLFVSFFPLLVAGPIERATHLLPQIKNKRNFELGQFVEGLKQILWGLFKKVVIADNCAEFVNFTYNHIYDYDLSGSTFFISAIFFSFQIYGDFSGYSDIAIGTGKLFGINLIKNFSFPYFSRDIAEFWRRWHISLSTWFRDYLYIPLGGSKVSFWIKIRNTFIIFIVSGFWHGANWTFIVWGFLNTLFILPSIIFNTNRNNLEIVAYGKKYPTLKEISSILLTFLLTTLAWIYFRSISITQAKDYILSIFKSSFFKKPDFHELNSGTLVISLLLSFFIIIEWKGREGDFALSKLSRGKSQFLRWLFYSFIIFLIGMYMQTSQTPFIYFNF
jgi:alginate O-acetyltransferase complex protein AlgI